jgi:4a-hydroxytetrahydrobiopterin dehydratase
MSTDEVERRLRSLEGWHVRGAAIERKYTFDGFASAIAFVVRVGFDAEAADHHPDILISNYKKVTLTYTTHSAGGLTEKDFERATAADRIAAASAAAG